VQRGAVGAVGHVYAGGAGERVRVDGAGGGDAVLPFFLHAGVHDEEGVVREVDRDGSLGLGVRVKVGERVGVRVRVRGIAGQDATYAELSSDAERERGDDGAGAEVRQLVAVPADGLGRVGVAVDEGGVGDPGEGGLEGEFWTRLDGLVDGGLDERCGVAEVGGELADILGKS